MARSLLGRNISRLRGVGSILRLSDTFQCLTRLTMETYLEQPKDSDYQHAPT
jgi:hypothetical protein